MSANTMTVLCPNGRRVTVKVTPHTSILQIIEDACKKQELDPDQYKLKHLRRVLDISSTVRYENLPNKCQLELITADVPRTAANVTVNIVTETGARIIQDFSSGVALWDILKDLEETGKAVGLLPPPGDDREPAIVYTMRRIVGQQLKNTTLKALGLTKGKCMLRHSLQSATSGTQAHVSAPLSRPKVSDPNREKKTPPFGQMNDGQASALAAQPLQDIQSQQQQDVAAREPQPSPPPPFARLPEYNPPQVPLQEHHRNEPNMQEMACSGTPDVVTSNHAGIPDLVQSQSDVMQPDVVSYAESPEPMDLIESSQRVSHPADDASVQSVHLNVVKFGSRNAAVLFSMDDAPQTVSENEDDSFFELTLDEAKRQQREIREVLRELEEAPLMTRQLREMEESAKTLSALNRYPITKLRICFPDNNVIQASFKSYETIAAVKDFIRPMLADPALEFNLYTRHPYEMVNESRTLVASGFVPNARLYFEPSQCQTGQEYLSGDTLSKKSSFTDVCNSTFPQKKRQEIQASRSLSPSEPSGESHEMEMPAGSANHIERRKTNRPSTGAISKAPKWFKTGK